MTEAKRLSLGEIIFIAVLSSALGVVWWAYTFLYKILNIALNPAGLSPLLEGMWLTGGLLFPYIIRKKGSAFLGEFIAASVQAAISGQWGFQSIIYGLIQGLAAEGVFALFRYNNYRIYVLAMAGVAAAIPSFFLSWFLYDYWKMGFTYNVIQISAFCASAVAFAIFSKLLADGMKKTGLLNHFEIAKEK